MLRRHHIIFLLAALIFASSGKAQETSAKQQQDYAFAMGLMLDGNYEIAFEEFLSYSRRYEGSATAPDAEFYAAECQYQRGLLTDAEIRFSGFIEVHKFNKLADDAWFRLGEVAFRQNRHEVAFERFEKIVRDFPDANTAHEAAYWAGESALKMEDHGRSRTFYTLAVENYPQGRIRDYAAYSLAYVDEMEKKYGDALRRYELFMEQYPGSALHSSAQTRIAACRFHLGEFNAALAWLDSLADSPDPENAAERLYIKSESQYQLGKYAQSGELCAAFLSAYPTHSRARSVNYTLAWCLLEQKKYNEAAAEFQKLSEGSDAVADAAAFRSAAALRLAGRIGMADEALEKLLMEKPGSDWSDNALFELGMSAWQSERYAEALKRFETVIDAHPGSDVRADAWYMAGETQMKLRKPAEAGPLFAAAKADSGAVESTRSNASFRLGHSYFESGRFDKASAAFRDFLRQHPDDGRRSVAHLWRGEALFHQGRFSEAYEAYAEAASEASDTGVKEDALYGQSWSLYKLGRYLDAERGFTRLAAEFPGGRQAMDAQVRLGDARYALKRFQDAARTYREAARNFPTHPLAPYALLQLANAEHKSGDTQAGISTIRKLLTSHPSSEYADDAQYNLAWLHFQAQNHDEAVREFEKLSANYPESPLCPKAAYSIGDSWYNRGRYKEAEKAYRIMISRYPASPLVADALDGIAQCLRMQGRGDEAARVTETWLAENRRSSIAGSVALADARRAFADGRLERATAMLGEFPHRYPGSSDLPEARLLLARVYSARGLNDSAHAVLRHLLPVGTDPSKAPEAAIELARLALHEQNPREALEIYDALLASPSLAGRSVELLCLRGAAHRQAGEAGAALEDFSRAASIDSTGQFGVSARIERARLLAGGGDVDAAVAELTKVASSRTDDLGAEAQYRAGEALMDARRLEDAERALLRVGYVYRQSADWSSKALLLLGAVYDRMGNSAKARETYRKIIDNYAGGDAAKEAAVRMERLK